MPRLIEHWGTVLRRSAVTWTTAALTFLVGIVGPNYQTLVGALDFLPSPLRGIAGGFLVFLLVGGPIILSRLVEQPAMQAKIKEKNSAEPSGNPPSA